MTETVSWSRLATHRYDPLAAPAMPAGLVPTATESVILAVVVGLQPVVSRGRGPAGLRTPGRCCARAPARRQAAARPPPLRSAGTPGVRCNTADSRAPRPRASHRPVVGGKRRDAPAQQRQPSESQATSASLSIVAATADSDTTTDRTMVRYPASSRQYEGVTLQRTEQSYHGLKSDRPRQWQTGRIKGGLNEL